MRWIAYLPCLTVVLVTLGCNHSHDPHGNVYSATPSSTPSVAEQWGIEVRQITLSAEGYMLDFRYRIIDTERAREVTKRQAQCYVIDQKSGARMIVPAPPKVGSLRNKSLEPVEGKTYYVMFANPGRRIRRGDKVTVVIDDMQIHDLEVQ